jgi:hypothetical protein
LARTLIEKRGRLSDHDVEKFLTAGFGRISYLITIVSASTISNYTGGVTKPPLEAQLQQYAWNS